MFFSARSDELMISSSRNYQLPCFDIFDLLKVCTPKLNILLAQDKLVRIINEIITGESKYVRARYGRHIVT